jgi:FkbM family methyltransferase
MRMSIKELLKRGIRSTGYEIKKIRLKEENKLKWLQEFDINTILDIGANIGVFTTRIHGLFPKADLYSFEPLKDVYEELQLHTRKLPNHRSYNVSLGDFNGTSTIKRNAFSPSSSLLELGQVHRDAFPFAIDTWDEEVIVKRLDDFLQEEKITPSAGLLIKLDVQGYEDRVIRGGEETFRKAKIIMAEVCFHEIYKGQVLFDGIFSLFGDMGFRCRGFYDLEYHPQTGMPLFADVVLERTPS